MFKILAIKLTHSYVSKRTNTNTLKFTEFIFILKVKEKLFSILRIKEKRKNNSEILNCCS